MAPPAGVPAPAPLIVPNWWLGIIPRDLIRKKKIFFGYEADFLPLAAGAGPTDVTTQIQPDSAFLALGINALVTDNANPPNLLWGSGFTNNALSGVLIQIRDVGSGQNLFQTPLPLDNVAGSGPFPAPLGLPYLFPEASSITTTLQALTSGVAVRNVRITYWGVRVYTKIPAATPVPSTR